MDRKGHHDLMVATVCNIDPHGEQPGEALAKTGVSNHEARNIRRAVPIGYPFSIHVTIFSPPYTSCYADLSL
jgi:hypothetical protein